MGILCDWEIKALSLGDKLIEPFVDHVVREENNRNILSYGLGSYGYDIRLSPKQCLLFGGTSAGVCDPKSFDKSILKETELREDEKGEYFLLPPYGYCLCVAHERLKLPEDVTVLPAGKSSYARTGIHCNITPAEGGWEGYLTLQISNSTGLFNRIYANEGITQLLFFRGKSCMVSYKDRKGKYQNQPKEVVCAKV
jgi:dCTP deaminase|tara:strand:- start:1859 stop:2446 length:588 start_codon:yes stop_codon:yes gene_type:complete